MALQVFSVEEEFAEQPRLLGDGYSQRGLRCLERGHLVPMEQMPQMREVM